jgi:hypothetical protein
MPALVTHCPYRMFELCDIDEAIFYSAEANELEISDWCELGMFYPVNKVPDQTRLAVDQLGPLVGRIHQRIVKCPNGTNSPCCIQDTQRHTALASQLKALKADLDSLEYQRDTRLRLFSMWSKDVVGTENGHYEVWRGPEPKYPKVKRKFFVETDPNVIHCRAVEKQQKHPPRIFNITKDNVQTIPQSLWPVPNRDYERHAFCRKEGIELRLVDDDFYTEQEYRADLQKLDGFYNERKARLLQQELDNMRTIIYSLKLKHNPKYMRQSTITGRWHFKNTIRREKWQYLLGANEYVIMYPHMRSRVRRNLRRPSKIFIKEQDELTLRLDRQKKEALATYLKMLRGEDNPSTWYGCTQLPDRESLSDTLFFDVDPCYPLKQWLIEWQQTYDPEPLPLVGIETNPGPNTKVQKQRKDRRPTPRVDEVTIERAMVPRMVPRPYNNNPKKTKKQKNLGEIVGKRLGRGIFDLVSHLTGFGDYKIDSNSLFNGGMDPPEMVNSINNGAFIVRHREYLRDINATVAFTLTPFNINPGLVSTFPWLAAVADQFEQYRFRGLVFEFKSLSSDSVLSSSTSSALGSVIMATQYDVLDSPFPNKFNMENYEYANSSKPSCSFYHPIECARNQTTITEQYVRSGSVPAGADQRFYDLGTFNIATVGMQAASGVCGELWCTYEIELLKPKLTTDEGYSILTDHYRLGTAASANPFGTTSVLAAGSNINGTFNTAGTIYTFPSFIVDGKYLILWSVIGGSVTLVNPAISSPGNGLAVLAYWNNDVSGSITIPNATVTTTAVVGVIVNILLPNAQFALSAGGTLPTAITGGDLWVTQVNGNIASFSGIDNTNVLPELHVDERDERTHSDHLFLKLLELVPRDQLIQFAQTVLT